MVRDIIHDEEFLKQESMPATTEDIYIADDLRDTLNANLDCCVGMAANMIGFNRRIIVFVENNKIQEMLNPVILKKDGYYEAVEGCLSLDGIRETKRYKKIQVQWQTREFKPRIRTFQGITAEIIQHEIDHLSGILI